ncbi:MAG: iron-sulfur cluster insertion protein ErpA [uncultured bacterium]|nr:MAG: iron-sulfur cluster insertion protein ErpA [uncultured bacterium]
MNENFQSVPTPISSNEKKPVLDITDNSIEYIKSYLSKKPDLADKHFRIGIEGGGCSGYQYNFSFDNIKEDDFIFEKNGVKVLVDPQSKLFIMGSLVDYTDDFRGSGFVVKNPNSKGSCGCGVSFSV